MSTSDGFVCFFAIAFSSDINFFFKFYSEKRRTTGLKLCEKKIGHHVRLGENNLSLILPTSPQKKPSWFGLCARSVRANDARNYAQYVMRNAILRNPAVARNVLSCVPDCACFLRFLNFDASLTRAFFQLHFFHWRRGSGLELLTI